MKKFTLVMVFAVLLSLAVVEAAFQDISIITEEVSPITIEPGNDVTLKVRVHNADSQAHSVTVNLQESLYFILKSSSQNLREEFLLCAGCSRENAYYLTVKPGTISGAYTLSFDITEAGTGLQQDITLEVKGVPDVVFSATLETDNVAPGEQFPVDIEVLNTGSAAAQNLKITPDSEKFIVLGSGLQLFEVLRPRERKRYTINFYASRELEAKAYTIPFTLFYKDDQGREYSVSQDIGVNVINRAELALKNIEIDPITARAGERLTIEGRVENIGEGDADNVRATLQSELEGVKVSYLGRLEKDDDGPIFFSGVIPVSGLKTDILIITYSDDRGQYTITEEFSYTVAPSRTGIIMGGVVVLLLILAGGLVWWVKKGKQRG